MAEPASVSEAEGPAEGAEAQNPAPPPGLQARQLLRAARAGTLATAIDGQPFASLVTPATAPDLSVLLLLSGLSEHTRHLRGDGRCAVIVAAEGDGINPQTSPRVTITGIAEVVDDAALKARWVALHPYAAFYADFADFSLWRIAPQGGLLVGGFAAAHRLRRADLTPDPEAVAAIAEAEAGIISHCNADHADAMDRIAHSLGGTDEGWLMVAVDVDGCDLAREERVMRVSWSAPVSGAGEVRRELVRMVK